MSLLVLLATLAAPATPATLAARAIDLANEYRIEESLAASEQARLLALQCDDEAGLARALDAIGVAERTRARTGVALDVTHEALAIAERIDDADVLARVHNDLGRIEFDLLTDYDAARAEYDRGLALEPRIRDRVTVARLLNNMANLARAENDFARAVTLYERAGEVSAKAKDRAGAIAAEHNVGLVYAQQNNAARAIVHLRRALTMERKAGQRAAAARTLLSISETQRALGRANEALTTLAQARSEASHAGDELTVATALLREAELRITRGELQRAERDLDRSLSVVERHRDVASIPLTLAYRAQLRFAQRRFRDAATVAADAATRAAALEQLDVVAQAQTLAGQAHAALQQVEEARQSYLAAVAAIEARRARVVGNEESRELYFSREVFPYLALVDLAAARRDAAEALAFAERAKGRVLLDVLRGGRADVPRLPADVAELVPSKSDAAIEFAVTNTRVVVFVITRNNGVRIAASLDRAQLLALANRFALEIAQRNLRFRTTSRALYDLLIAPAEPLLGGTQRLCIVPDGELWRVPFQALLAADDGYLVEHTELFFAPSLAVLREIVRARDRTSSRDLLAVANAELPEALAEVTAVRAAYGAANANVLTTATASRVQSEVPAYRLLHVAAHGVFDDADPLHSHLLFANGSTLDARQMMQLRLTADLVVLSACETAAGRPVPGEGMIGMSWALFVAGCPAMVASQWRVESASTTAMMVGMHRRLASGDSVAAALREAQLDVLHTPRYEHPFYWASFVLLGKGW